MADLCGGSRSVRDQREFPKSREEFLKNSFDRKIKVVLYVTKRKCVYRIRAGGGSKIEFPRKLYIGMYDKRMSGRKVDWNFIKPRMKYPFFDDRKSPSSP